MIAFIRNLIGVKTDQAVQGALETLVKWDPKSATDAELRTMEQQLDELGLQVAQARAAYDREQREADAINNLSHQRMAAAEQLERQLQAEPDPGRKAGLEKSLATLVGMLEQMAPDIDREIKDARDAQEFLEMLEQTYQQAGAKLKQARSELDRAQRDMQRAGQQREVAERRAEAARQSAGLTSATSGLNVALKAMQDSAQKNLEAAEAASAKAKLLQASKPEQDDPNIAAALASAAGGAPPNASLTDRLSALRSRPGLAAPQSQGRFLPGSS
jgi:chromosome segregation ATPase